MIVIGVVGGKGGTGKSTVSLGLATEAAAKVLVSLLDMDPQAATTRWHAARVANEVGGDRGDGRRNPDLFRVPRDRDGNPKPIPLADVIDRLSAVHEDVLIIDSGPGSTRTTREIIGLSHACVVPINPSPVDMTANDEAITLLRAKGVPYLIVLNRVAGGAGKAYADQIAGLIEDAGLPLARTRIAARQSYVECWIDGMSGPEADAKAKKEMASLWTEVRALAEARARLEAGE